MLSGILDYATLGFVHLTKWVCYSPPCLGLSCALGPRALGTPVLLGYFSVSSSKGLGTVAGRVPRNRTRLLRVYVILRGGREAEKRAIPKSVCRNIEDENLSGDSQKLDYLSLDYFFG